MKGMLKLSTGFGLLLSAYATFAGTMGTEVMSPECKVACNIPSWEFAGRALYLQTEYGHDPWVTEREIIDAIAGYVQTPALIKEYGWAGFGEAKYHFESDKAFDLNIYYLDNTHHYQDRLSNNGLRRVTQESKWFAANFELWQVLPIADNKAVKGFISVNYTDLSKTRPFYREINDLSTTNLTTIRGKSRGGFHGGGPRWGLDFTYYLPAVPVLNGFSVHANGAFSVLFGRSTASLSVLAESISLSNGYRNSTDQFSVVFMGDGRFGLDYSLITQQGVWRLEVGWVGFNYLSAIENKANAESTDVIYQGGYAGIRWLGTIT